MDETVSHPAFLRIAVGISPLVMIPTFTLTINPRCSGKFFPPPPAGFWHSHYVLRVSTRAWCAGGHRQHAGGRLPVSRGSW
jgi:hypothetical protein